MKRHKIILDIDNATGIIARDVDDGLALALALASPEVELLGCTTCAGNCRTHESTDITLRMLELAGRTDIPVAYGREYPFIQDVSASYAYIDGWSKDYADHWTGSPVLAPATTQASQPAHEFIIEQVRKYPGEVTIVKEGSLTNLALALLVDPEIAPMVKSVVHMGGDVGEPWWATPGSAAANDDARVWRHIVRMNTVYDPDATEIVARSGIPFTFVTSKVCAKVLLRPEHVDKIAAVGTPWHDYLAEVSRPWVNWQVNVRGRQGACMWDPLTLAVVFEPDFCVFGQMRFDINKWRNWEFPYIYQDSGSVQVGVSLEVQIERFENFLVERLCMPPTAG